MNQLTASLAAACREHLLREKLVVAPSLRIGHQWLETIARGGQPVLNARIQTISGLALELARPIIATQGVSPLSELAGELLVANIWRALQDGSARGAPAPSDAYLAKLQPNDNLARAIYASIKDLRLAGVEAQAMRLDAFESRAKGRELALVLRQYDDALRRRKLVDLADILRMAAGRLRENGLPRDLLALAVEDDERRELEKLLLAALPAANLIVLPKDEPIVAPLADAGKEAILAQWLADPCAPLPPEASEILHIFQAVGEVNEAREVLRRCLRAGINLDDVEVLYTDKATYLPIFYELSQQFREEEDGTPGQPLPMTFAEGIPISYSRPGRALTAWIQWLRDDFPQSVMTRMIQDGLIDIPGMDGQGFSFSHLAATLRAIPIAQGRQRYKAIANEIGALRHRLARRTKAGEEDKLEAKQQAHLRQRLQAAQIIQARLNALLALAPETNASQADILKSARTFLEKHARCNDELDNYARDRLIEEIAELAELIEKEREFSLDIFDRLASLPRTKSVLGKNPLPGHLHVAQALDGGHSGRKHTFIVGLDDGRFPGAMLQDPLLLDSERKGLSAALATSRPRLRLKLDRLMQLLARLRGTVTLSFSCRDLVEDRPLFPSQIIVSAWRFIAANHAAPGASERGLRPPASFAPDREGGWLDESEWWMWRLCAQSAGDVWGPLARRFPHLGRGREARKRRDSSAFTEYDGYAPQAGADFDPAADHGAALSASKLEMMGACPLRFFFARILELEPPEELKIDRDAWLSPLDRGSLLHEVFRRFLSEAMNPGERPDHNSPKRQARIEEILDEQVLAYRERFPIPSEPVFRRELNAMRRAAEIFLRLFTLPEFADSRPAFLEAAIGMPAEPGQETALDSPQPARIALPGGTTIRARGRIDRVDRVGDESNTVFSIWDYKTGGADKYKKLANSSNIHAQGRIVQHTLYLALAEQALREKISPRARVERVGYLFPSDRKREALVSFTPEQLANGLFIIEALARMIAAGAFPATTDAKDCAYCDHAKICGIATPFPEQSRAKLNDNANTMLKDFRALRKGDHEEGE